MSDGMDDATNSSSILTAQPENSTSAMLLSPSSVDPAEDELTPRTMQTDDTMEETECLNNDDDDDFDDIASDHADDAMPTTTNDTDGVANNSNPINNLSLEGLDALSANQAASSSCPLPFIPSELSNIMMEALSATNGQATAESVDSFRQSECADCTRKFALVANTYTC